MKKSDTALVQTMEMKRKFINHFGNRFNVKVLNITSDIYAWPSFYRTGRVLTNKERRNITLLYPSDFYPHKNHHLLNEISLPKFCDVLVTLPKSTISEIVNGKITYIGKKTRDEIYELYKKVDALLFLSSNESLGMPVLEAVKCNLPIICPYAEYTKNLDARYAFFFDLKSPKSLDRALVDLEKNICRGWWPAWNFKNIYGEAEAVNITEALI